MARRRTRQAGLARELAFPGVHPAQLAQPLLAPRDVQRLLAAADVPAARRTGRRSPSLAQVHRYRASVAGRYFTLAGRGHREPAPLHRTAAIDGPSRAGARRNGQVARSVRYALSAAQLDGEPFLYCGRQAGNPYNARTVALGSLQALPAYRGEFFRNMVRKNSC